MSDAAETESKTEEATEQRKRDAAGKGDSPTSRDAVALASIAMCYVAVLYSGSIAAPSLMLSLGRLVALSCEFSLQSQYDLGALLTFVARDSAGTVVALTAIVGTGGIAPVLLQSNSIFNGRRLRFTPSRLLPTTGLKRLFGTPNLQEFAKSSAKLVTISIAGIFCWLGDWATVAGTLNAPEQSLPSAVEGILLRLLLTVASSMVAFAAVDLFLTRRQWHARLRMTKQEVKDEIKQSEGDRALGGRRRAIARKRIMRPLASSVPRATFVVANPTHVSVALRYVKGEIGAPEVVAKGLDKIALRIKSLAHENGIPVIHDVHLARSLYSQVDVDKVIPPQFYRAVADLIITLQRSGRQSIPAVGSPPR